VHVQDAGTGKQLGSYSETLLVTGKPDPTGGTVCQSVDDGQPFTYIGNADNGITYRETYTLSCSGTYKGGKLSYTETTTSDKAVYSDGVSCVGRTPSFTSTWRGLSRVKTLSAGLSVATALHGTAIGVLVPS
jgi:hypothetical protein